MAHAIENLLGQHCPPHKMRSTVDYLACQRRVDLKGTELLKAIRNVTFVSITGREVKFLKDKENIGDGLAPFEIFQYQQLEPGKYGYLKITEWEKDKRFHMDKSKLKWNFERPKSLPKSVCKEECSPGEIKQGDKCCWVCVRCEENEYVSANRKECVQCRKGFGPTLNKTACVKLIVEHMSLDSLVAVVPLVFSTIGVLITLFCIFIFIK